MYICSNVQNSRYHIATRICTICVFRVIYYLEGMNFHFCRASFVSFSITNWFKEKKKHS